MKNRDILFFSAILVAISPLIHSKTAIYGTTVYSTVYFWFVIDASSIIYLLFSKKNEISLNILHISILVYAIINLLSAIFGHDITLNLLSSFDRMSGFLSTFHLVFYFYLFYNTHFSQKQLNILIVTVLLVGLLINLFGIIEYLNGKHYRAESILGNPMHLSIYALIQFYIIVYSFSIWKSYPAKLFLILLILVTCTCLILTQTRAGILSLLVGLSFIGIYYLLNSKKNTKLIVFTILCLAALVSVFAFSYYSKIPILNRFTKINLEDDTLWVRIKLWKMCLNNSLEKPFLGWGQGSFIYFYFKNFTSDLNNAGFWYDSAHNEFIDKIIGTGFIGFLSYLWLISITFFGIWEKNINYLTQFDKVMLTAFLLTYITFMFFGFDSISSLIAFFTIFVIINKNFKPIYNQALFHPIKFTTISILLIILYYGVYKTFSSNKAFSLAYSEKDAEKKIALYNKAFDNAFIGKYNIASEFALQRNLFLNSSLPQSLKDNYYNSSNRILNDALDIHTDNPVLLNQLGFLKLDYGLSDESVKIFEKMNRMSPNRLINNHDYALVLFKNNQISKSFEVIDKVIQNQKYNQKAILLKTRFFLEKKQSKEAFNAINKFDSKEVLKNFIEITNLVIEYQVYNEFYDFLYEKYGSNLEGFYLENDEKLISWCKIAQLSKNKQHVHTVFSYYTGNTLLGNDGRFRNKKDSLKVIELVNMVHEGRANYDIILSLKYFE